MQKFAMVFPGQGSQKLGMLSDLAVEYAVVEATFNEASSVLGQDLWDIAQLDGGNTLDQTHITQPILLTASIAIWRVWQERGAPMPAILAGHSLGEYSALVCAGALGFSDAVNLVHHRGLYMQEAVPAGEGKMAAIVGLENDQIRTICEQASEGEIVSAANYNSPGQTVIAGNTSAVERAMVLCKEAGAKRALPLNVSVPSHCLLMKSAASRLQADLDAVSFSDAGIPVVQNVSGAIATAPDDIKANLIKQLYAPVLWVDSVQLMHKDGIRQVVECGPGKVLCGLLKRIESDLACLGSDDPDSLDSAIAEVSA